MRGVSQIVVLAVSLLLATATSCHDAITGSGGVRIRGSFDLQDAWGNALTDRSGVEVAVDGNAAHAMTDASGAWQLDGVSPGHHDVIFTKPRLARDVSSGIELISRVGARS